MCLKVFIQANWTGPEVKIDDLGLLGDIVTSKASFVYYFIAKHKGKSGNSKIWFC